MRPIKRFKADPGMLVEGSVRFRIPSIRVTLGMRSMFMGKRVLDII